MMKNRAQAQARPSFKLALADSQTMERKESNDPIYLNLHPLWKQEQNDEQKDVDDEETNWVENMCCLINLHLQRYDEKPCCLCAFCWIYG